MLNPSDADFAFWIRRRAPATFRSLPAYRHLARSAIDDVINAHLHRARFNDGGLFALLKFAARRGESAESALRRFAVVDVGDSSNAARRKDLARRWLDRLDRARERDWPRSGPSIGWRGFLSLCRSAAAVYLTDGGEIPVEVEVTKGRVSATWAEWEDIREVAVFARRRNRRIPAAVDSTLELRSTDGRRVNIRFAAPLPYEVVLAAGR